MMELSDEESPPVTVVPGQGDGEGEPGWDTIHKMFLMVKKSFSNMFSKKDFQTPTSYIIPWRPWRS